MKKTKPLSTVVGMETDTAIMQKSREVPQKIENRTNKYDPAIPLMDPKGNEIIMLMRYLHSHVHWNIIQSSPEMETT